MTELLAPAGNMEAFKAAISNGCDAIYLGMQKFGARAYSSNFDIDSLREAIRYAHLRDVLVYVTMNTIVFEDELEEMREQLRILNDAKVDGIIIQDLAVFNFVVKNFIDMEAHCSTQMGIDDLAGTILFKELGADRVVLSREVPINKVKEIRRVANIPIEIFVHGALCVSYSGNCLMSGLIGYRSGNRGRCVGSCRKPYELINITTGENLGNSYILSMKDLNTIDNIEELRDIDSLKIEGRMKEPAYVANVVAKYRQALDGTLGENEEEQLAKTFNRTFTRGYMFGEDPKNITNIVRPNNYGQRIGVISRYYKGMYEIELEETLYQNDIIRIDCGDEDVNLSVVKMYDRAGNLINKADDVCYIKVKERLEAGDVVYKTKDYNFYKELEQNLDKEFRRFDLNVNVYAYPGANLIVNAEAWGLVYTYEGDEVLDAAVNNPTTKEQVVKQLTRLSDTVFKLGRVEYEECGAFVPAKLLNKARREIVEALYEMKLDTKQNRVRETEVSSSSAAETISPVHYASGAAEVASNTENISPIHYASESTEAPEVCSTGGPGSPVNYASEVAETSEANSNTETGSPVPFLTASVATLEQLEACREAGIETIYYEDEVVGELLGNTVRRNQVEYSDREGELLLGGYGGIEYYRGKNEFVTDYSLNVVNSVACRELMELGAKRVTLSYEMNKKQIADLIAAYRKNYGADPELEMIVYGRAPLLFTKYCPLKKLGQCGRCRENFYELKDEHGTFPILSHKDCTTTILNGKVLNLLNEMKSIEGVAAFRLNFTTEGPEEVRRVIEVAKKKLSGEAEESAFDQKTDTRGHFNREIM